MKLLIFLGMALGYYAGSLVPMLWGGSMFSLSSILLGAFGAFLGIALGFKIGKTLGLE